MYRIRRSGNTLGTGLPYFIGEITRQDWLDSTEETYCGELSDLEEDTKGKTWMIVGGGHYEDVKSYCEAGCQ